MIASNILYDPFGPVRQWAWGNGTLAVRTFDQDGKVTQIDSAGLKNYGYDDAFRITSITDATSSGLSWTHSYDDLDRLVGASKPGTTLGYEYDANGNRLAQTGGDPSMFTVAANSNRITASTGALMRTYTYDNAGNTTALGDVTFIYDSRGRMESATKGGVTTAYLYNALGQRVKKTTGGVSRYFVYDEAGHLIGEYDSAGSLIQEVIWLDDIPVAMLRPNGAGDELFYIHADHLDTPRKISRPADNVVVWRWDSDPFGVSAANGDPDGDAQLLTFNPRFPGQYWDAETEMHYNYFRDYDPSTGRYIQSDPIGLDGGLNTYLYADANPVLNVDPVGEVSVAAVAAAVGAAAIRICRGIATCRAQLAELTKKALELCKRVDCTVRFDREGHPFNIPGVGDRLCMHWQIDCHIEGVKRSGFSIHSRLPVCWKRGEPFPRNRPPSRLP